MSPIRSTLATLTMIAPIALLGACSTASSEPTYAGIPRKVPPIITAPVISASGARIGTAVVRTNPTAIEVRIEVSGLTPGLHGAHLHEVGRCDGPDFASAGGHWNPDSHQHGHRNPAGWHLGDLGNLLVGPNGTADKALIAHPGMNPSDADGTSLVIHSGADDEMTDPSGNSGSRIACAVIMPPQ